MCYKVVSMLLLWSLIGLAGPCDDVINTCQVLTRAQDKQILDLKAENKVLGDKLSISDSIFPSWVWIGLGTILGGAIMIGVKK